MQLKVRGKLLVRLNMTPRPIANKYREGKLKSTLNRESKDRETAQSISQWHLEDCVLAPPGVTPGRLSGRCVKSPRRGSLLWAYTRHAGSNGSWPRPVLGVASANRSVWHWQLLLLRAHLFRNAFGGCREDITVVQISTFKVHHGTLRGHQQTWVCSVDRLVKLVAVNSAATLPA